MLQRWKIFCAGLCGLAQFSCAPPASIEQADTKEPKQVMESQTESGGVANLPYARGKTFGSLDEYLAYLEQYNGPLDMPWWREIAPGTYRQQIRMADGPEPETATRAELAARFGFATDE